MSLAHLLGSSMVVGGLLASGAARAGAPPLTVESYVAAAACPTEADFRAQWEREHAGREGARAITLAIGIGSDGARFRGHVAITPAEGEASVRVVTGSTCGEVVSALALIAGLSVDSTTPP